MLRLGVTTLFLFEGVEILGLLNALVGVLCTFLDCSLTGVKRLHDLLAILGENFTGVLDMEDLPVVLLDTKVSSWLFLDLILFAISFSDLCVFRYDSTVFMHFMHTCAP